MDEDLDAVNSFEQKMKRGRGEGREKISRHRFKNS